MDVYVCVFACLFVYVYASYVYRQDPNHIISTAINSDTVENGGGAIRLEPTIYIGLDFQG